MVFADAPAKVMNIWIIVIIVVINLLVALNAIEIVAFNVKWILFWWMVHAIVALQEFGMVKLKVAWDVWVVKIVGLRFRDNLFK